MWLPLACHPPLETWPATQACVLTENRNCNPLVCRPALSPLSHTSQGTHMEFLNLLQPCTLGSFMPTLYTGRTSVPRDNMCRKRLLQQDQGQSWGPTEPQVPLPTAQQKAVLTHCPSHLTQLERSWLQAKARLLSQQLRSVTRGNACEFLQVISGLCPYWGISAPPEESDVLPWSLGQPFPGELLWSENCGKTCGAFLGRVSECHELLEETCLFPRSSQLCLPLSLQRFAAGGAGCAYRGSLCGSQGTGLIL